MHALFVVNAQRIFSTSYTMDDGLAANRVYSILQDSCGFMWFGTDDGLSRFDGIAFKNYYLSEYINATTSNSVKKIFIDRRGRMWIGLDTGIVIYDSKTDTFQPFHAKTETGEMIQTYVTDMIEDSDGEVWIATSGEGLYRFSPSDKVRLRVYRNIPGKANSISQNTIMTLQQDSKQNIWIEPIRKDYAALTNRKTRSSLTKRAVTLIVYQIIPFRKCLKTHTATYG